MSLWPFEPDDDTLSCDTVRRCISGREAIAIDDRSISIEEKVYRVVDQKLAKVWVTDDAVDIRSKSEQESRPQSEYR